MSKLALKSELKQFSSAKRAAEFADQRLSQLDFSPGAKLIQSLALRVRAIPGDLSKDVSRGGFDFGITDEMKGYFVVFADCGGMPACLSFDDGYVIALDKNFVLKSFVVVYYSLGKGPHHRQAGVAAITLAPFTIEGPLPYQDELVWFALKSDPIIANTILW